LTDFKQEHPAGVILTVDQMSLYFQATTTRVWARRGQTPTLRVATQRDHVHFYGALDVCSGHESALRLPKQSGEMTCHFLDHLLSIYPGRALFILWDRAKWHTGAVVRDYLSQHPHIQTLHFPPGSPQLNPQEHVWELTRDAVSHNHTRKNFPALVQAFHHHLENTCFKFQWIEKYVPSVLLAT
jgi:transposase